MRLNFKRLVQKLIHPNDRFMPIPEDLLRTLRTWHRMPAGELLARLQVSRATLMRAALEDMRPQGFLGRNFARHHADQPGNCIVGEPAYRRWLAQSQQGPTALPEEQLESAHLVLAEDSMALGVAGSSAGGEFPKFTAHRSLCGTAHHVIVKFSGSARRPAPGAERGDVRDLRERDAWRVAATAAMHFWTRASGDARISEAFRQVCAQNALTVRELCASPLVTNPG